MRGRPGVLERRAFSITAEARQVTSQADATSPACARRYSLRSILEGDSDLMLDASDCRWRQQQAGSWVNFPGGGLTRPSRSRSRRRSRAVARLRNIDLQIDGPEKRLELLDSLPADQFLKSEHNSIRLRLGSQQMASLFEQGFRNVESRPHRDEASFCASRRQAHLRFRIEDTEVP